MSLIMPPISDGIVIQQKNVYLIRACVRVRLVIVFSLRSISWGLIRRFGSNKKWMFCAVSRSLLRLIFLSSVVLPDTLLRLLFIDSGFDVVRVCYQRKNFSSTDSHVCVTRGLGSRRLPVWEKSKMSGIFPSFKMWTEKSVVNKVNCRFL